MFSGTGENAAEAVRLPAPKSLIIRPASGVSSVIFPCSDHKPQIFNLAFLLLAAGQRVNPCGVYTGVPQQVRQMG